MTADQTINSASSFRSKEAIKALVGGLIGAGSGYFSIVILKWLHIPVKTLAWSDLLALVLGLAFFCLGLATLALTANRKRLAESLQSEDKTMPATNEEVRSFRLHAWTMLLAGILLILPLLAMSSAKSSPTRLGIFVLIVFLFALQTAINVRIWIVSDEFVRAMMLQLGTMTFWIVQGAIFLWAAAEHLQLVRAITSWDIVTLLFTCYLVVSVVVAIRNRP